MGLRYTLIKKDPMLFTFEELVKSIFCVTKLKREVFLFNLSCSQYADYNNEFQCLKLLINPAAFI